MVSNLFDVSGDEEVTLRLHVQPGAGRTAVSGTHGEALKVRVAAPPEGGRANDAVVALVASTLDVKPAAVELLSGESSRTKRVRVTGVAADDVERLLTLALDAATAAGRPERSRRDERR